MLAGVGRLGKVALQAVVEKSVKLGVRDGGCKGQEGLLARGGRVVCVRKGMEDTN